MVTGKEKFRRKYALATDHWPNRLCVGKLQVCVVEATAVVWLLYTWTHG